MLLPLCLTACIVVTCDRMFQIAMSDMGMRGYPGRTHRHLQVQQLLGLLGV